MQAKMNTTRKYRHIILSLLALGVFFSYTTAFPQNDHINDSLRNVLKFRNHKGLYDEETLKTLNLLMQGYCQTEANAAFEYSRMALEIIPKIKNKATIQYTYNRIGVVFFYMGLYDSALVYYQKSMAINKEMNEYGGLAYGHTDVGYILHTLELHELAEEQYKIALKIFTDLNDSTGIAHALASLSANYRTGKRYAEAFETIVDATKIRTALNDKRGIIQAKNYTGRIYLDMNLHREALKNFAEAHDLAIEIADTEYMAHTSRMLGLCYSGMDSFALSNSHLQSAIYFFRRIGFKNLIAKTYITIAENFIKRSIYQYAINYLDTALELSVQTNSFPEQLKIYKLRKEIAAVQNKYSDAYNFSQKESELNSIIFNKKITLIVSNIRLETEISEKLEHIKLLEKHNELQQNFINRGILIIVLAAIFFMATVFLLSIFYKRVKETRKLNNLLSIQKSEIENKNSLLQNKTKELEETVNTRDKFISIIAHDLRNPFHSMTSISELLMGEENNLSTNEKNELIQSLNLAANQGYKLLENLLDWVQYESGRVVPRFETLDLNHEIKQVLPLILSHAREKKLVFKNDVGGGFNIQGDRNMIRTVLRNILSNAVKYSFYNSEIRIFKQVYPDKTELIIQDFGKGMTSQQIADVTSRRAFFSLPGTSGEQGSGLGLKLCFEFIRLNKGDLHIISKIGHGSLFVCSFPNLSSQTNEISQ